MALPIHNSTHKTLFYVFLLIKDKRGRWCQWTQSSQKTKSVPLIWQKLTGLGFEEWTKHVSHKMEEGYLKIQKFSK